MEIGLDAPMNREGIAVQAPAVFRMKGDARARGNVRFRGGNPI